MNTANLQLEGICAILAALVAAMRDKGLLDGEEIDRLLASIENNLVSDPRRPAELRGANIDAICFPVRFLRRALETASEGGQLSFVEVAGRVGLTKPDR